MKDKKPSIVKEEFLKDLAEEIRLSTFETIRKAGSGHLGSCSSSAELLTALYFGGILRYDPANPEEPSRDRVYLRGHLGPLRYKIFSLLGWIKETELKEYRSFGSRLKGHESMDHTPGVDLTPSGSLGMVLSYAVGSAISTGNLGLPSRHYAFIGDGEEQEGNISEAARHAASLGLENLITIIDRNEKQLSNPTAKVDSKADLRKIWEGYGWRVLSVKDGHSIPEVLLAYQEAAKQKFPTLIIASTEKGRGLGGNKEHYSGYHTIGSCSDKGVIDSAIALGRKSVFLERSPKEVSRFVPKVLRGAVSPNQRYQFNMKVNPKNNLNPDNSQIDYIHDLIRFVEDKKIPFYFLTPDLLPQPTVELLGLNKLKGFMDVGIREQHAIAMAHGISKTEPNARILMNFFDAFLYRGSDQLNAAAQGRSNLVMLSELSGLMQGKNGSTHQSSGQSAVPIFMPGVTFFEPADVQDLYNVLNESFSMNNGPTIIRSHRGNIFPLKRRKGDENCTSNYVVYDSENPQITLAGSGFLVGNMVRAVRELEAERGILARVINIVSPQRLGSKFNREVVDDRPLLIFYNGNPKMLTSLISQSILEGSPRCIPSTIISRGFFIGETGSVEDLVKHFGLDSESIKVEVLKNYGG